MKYAVFVRLLGFGARPFGRCGTRVLANFGCKSISFSQSSNFDFMRTSTAYFPWIGFVVIYPYWRSCAEGGFCRYNKRSGRLGDLASLDGRLPFHPNPGVLGIFNFCHLDVLVVGCKIHSVVKHAYEVVYRGLSSGQESEEWDCDMHAWEAVWQLIEAPAFGFPLLVLVRLRLGTFGARCHRIMFYRTICKFQPRRSPSK